MQITLFNTLTRKKNTFKSIKPNQVGIYTCGPTVYNYAHIGNLRTYIFEDLIIRVLKHAGYTVNHIMNITDVGHLESDADDGIDKMELATKRENKNPWEIAKFYEKAFFSDFELLNMTMPSIISRATDNIAEIISFIKALELKGFTYTVDGNVYFKINKSTNYAELTGRNISELTIVPRVESDHRKENPLDFVLWFSNSKFPHQIMKWDSPWGIGFPGWHIECSAIASKHLGNHFDIHCGGIDHIPVHHTNEIAQSEGCFGHRWVNYWLHGEFLILTDGKMSKSSGKYITLSTLMNNGFDPLHYRYLCLTAHYRSQLFFSEENLTAARNAFEGLKNRIISWKLDADRKARSIDKEKMDLYQIRFWKNVYDDINMPIALSVVWEMAKDKQLSSCAKLKLAYEFDQILGFNMDAFSRPTLNDNLMTIVHERERARDNKNWTKADALRDELLSHGVQIKDLKEGSDWYLHFE